MSNITYCIYNCLSEDEPTRFKTCRRKHKFNINLIKYAFRWFVLYNCTTTHDAKKHKEERTVSSATMDTGALRKW
jgi:hypothetical protein